MAEKDPTEMKDCLKDFFSGKTRYLPRVCFSETNPNLGDNTVCVVALSNDFPNFSKLLADDPSIIVFSSQIEKVGDLYLSYMLIEDTTTEGGLDKLEGLFKKNESYIEHRMKRLSSIERNPFTYPVKYGKGMFRSLCMDLDIFHAMFRVIPNSLGSGGDYLMYLSGVSIADLIWNKYDFSDQEDIEEQFLMLEDIFRTLGFGIVEIKDIDPLRMEGSIKVCKSMEGSLSGSCTMFRGILSELVKRIFEDPKIEVVETACVNRGDPECLFELTRSRGP